MAVDVPYINTDVLQNVILKQGGMAEEYCREWKMKKTENNIGITFCLVMRW